MQYLPALSDRLGHAVLLALMLACGTPALAANAAMRVATTDLPPYAIEGGGERPGAIVELVRELGRRAGMPAMVEFVPWKRAVFMAGSLPRAAVFPLTRSPEREESFRWLVPLFEERFAFIGPSGRFDPAQPLALRTRPVAVLRGSTHALTLRDKGYTNIIEAASLLEGLRFVRRGIADALYAEVRVADHLYRQQFPGEPFVTSEAVSPPTASWLGGSPGFTEEEAARLQQALREVVGDGTYAAIMKKYGLPAVAL